MAIGAWGDAGDALMIAAPLVALVGVTLGCPRVPATVTLPVTAAAAAVVRAGYLGSPASVLAAAVVGGALEAITPLSIVAGAMTLFAVMDATGCLRWATAALAGVTGGHPVAEAMLIGWSFGHVVEGGRLADDAAAGMNDGLGTAGRRGGVGGVDRGEAGRDPLRSAINGL